MLPESKAAERTLITEFAFVTKRANTAGRLSMVNTLTPVVTDNIVAGVVAALT